MSRPTIVRKAFVHDRAAHLTFLERCILRHQPSTLLNQLPNKAFPPYDLIDEGTLQTLFETAFLHSGQIPTEISALYRLYFGPRSGVCASSSRST
ncbi:hypothetical protein GL50803_0028069 [Giardia duodenalis]|uniref:Uncharacterized protein n=1 Tax=Giardia intestinalis (strain ATCC 50803 / WB clone C6) TaxID=184922 RepID=D3KGZ1_GIAIC|nr:hypothetical protein GL50803_0028069 [Giardia intestinalis]KAE8301326.1 hypothetical protein GL50803_0028069 [Giardia intestinalis]